MSRRLSPGQRAHLLWLCSESVFGLGVDFDEIRRNRTRAAKMLRELDSDYHAFLWADVGDTRRNQ